MQQAVKRRILYCRMVRDNLNKTAVQSQKQNHPAETQSQPAEEPAGPKHAQSPESVNPKSPEPTERPLGLLHWNKFSFEEEPETWPQVSTEVEAQIGDFIALGC